MALMPEHDGAGGPGRTGSVLVVGSVNVDVTVRVQRFPVPGETLLGNALTEGVGGKGANQAVAAARAGARVRLLGSVGDDAGGRGVRAALEELGVGTELLVTSPTHPTGRAHITVDGAGQNSIIVVPGANTATSPARLDDEAAGFGAVDVVVVQGEVPPETAEAVLDRARRTDSRVVLNLAPVIDLPPVALAAAAVLVVNETEAGVLLGAPEPVTVPQAMDAARQLTRQVPCVVLTVGAAGAVLAERDGQVVHVPAPRPARVVDTTGAGDALVGVLAAALARGVDIGPAVADGVRAATMSVERAGAAASYPPFGRPD